MLSEPDCRHRIQSPHLSRKNFTSCVTDPGGGVAEVNQCFKTNDGATYLFHKNEFLEASPAPQRFWDLIASACELLDAGPISCKFTPMVVNIGQNAVAGLCSGERVVFLDRNMEDLFGPVGTKFAIFHELGHHFCGHLHQRCSSENELEADAFAGAGLRRLGVSLAEATRLWDVLVGVDRGIHPSLAARTDAVATGWTQPDLATKCLLKLD